MELHATLKRDYIDARDGGGLAATIAAIGSTPATVKVLNTQTLTAPLTIPINVNLIVEKTGYISNGVHALSITGVFSAGRYRIFDSFSGISFSKGSLSYIYPEWVGAKCGADANFALNSTAIADAIMTGMAVEFTSGYYYHNGIVVTPTASINEFVMKGTGRFKTVLYCQQAGTHNLSVSASGAQWVNQISIRDMGFRGLGSAGAGAGIYLSGVIWWIIEKVHTTTHGSHGIHITNPGSVAGSFVGVIRDCKSNSNLGDGIYQVATDSGHQQNDSIIQANECASNANGITVWGYRIAVIDNVIENNTGYGIRIQNFRVAAPIYSASNILIYRNYMEGHPSGQIYIKTDAINSGVITNLVISNNYSFYSAATAGYIPVVFVSAGNENEVRGLRYENNSMTGPVALNVEADFGGCLAQDCVIFPEFQYFNTAYNAYAIFSKYINTGRAYFHHIKSITMPGWWLAKGGSNISYIASMLKSDNIVANGSTYFPLQIPNGAHIDRIDIPVETDATAFSVGFNVLGRASNVGAYATVGGMTYTNNGTGATVLISQIVTTGNRMAANVDLVLLVTVTLTTPGTYFYLGNPTVYYI